MQSIADALVTPTSEDGPEVHDMEEMAPSMKSSPRPDLTATAVGIDGDDDDEEVVVFEGRSDSFGSASRSGSDAPKPDPLSVLLP